MHRVIKQNIPAGYMSVSEFAQATGMKAQSVRYMIQRRRLAFVKVGVYFFVAKHELTRCRQETMRDSLKSMPLDVFDYARGCGPAPEVV